MPEHDAYAHTEDEARGDREADEETVHEPALPLAIPGGGLVVRAGPAAIDEKPSAIN